MRIRIAEAFLGFACLVFALIACSATKTEIDPRFVAVHNTLSSMGLAQVGPMQQGTLAEGREARLTVDLPAQCTTVVVIGSAGVRDVDLTVLDPQGNALGHDTTHGPEAVVRACAEAAGTYTLVVRMAAGGGDFLTGLWSGSVGGALASAQIATGDGTCESPHVLTAGSFSGSTSHGSEDSEGEDDCNRSRGRETVYRMELSARKRFVLDVEARFDTVVYVRRDDCVDGEQVACNDDATNSNSRQPPSHVDAVLEPGVYWVYVDSSSDAGSYRMAAQLLDVPTLADACRQARPLSIGAALNGTTHNGFDHAHATCGEDAKGRDVVYRFDLGQRSRVRILEHSDEITPVVYVRRTCADAQTEISCSDTSGADSEAAFVGVLDAGQYAVFADGSDPDQEGRFTLEAQVAPEQGTGTQGDACVDAVPLNKNNPDVQGDTFDAKDDVAGKCGGAGAPDVVYRIDVQRRSRITARFLLQDGKHVMVLQRSCADKASEISCVADGLDETLNPGTYYLGIDGERPDTFGRFGFEFHIKDIAAQDAACKAPPELKSGQTVTGSTAGAGDKFVTACAGRDDVQASADRVYRVVVTQRTHARFVLVTPVHDGVLSLRKACHDPPGATSGRAGELTCNNDSDDNHHSRIETVLEPGSYFLVVDGYGVGQEGPFTVEYKGTIIP